MPGASQLVINKQDFSGIADCEALIQLLLVI